MHAILQEVTQSHALLSIYNSSCSILRAVGYFCTQLDDEHICINADVHSQYILHVKPIHVDCAPGFSML